MKRFIFLLSFLSLVGINLLGQGVQITGNVVSADDATPLPGVSVVVRGTTIGAVTDFEGNYSITVPGSSAVLMFSFVGMTTQEINVEGQTTIDVVLDADMFGLDEVVVTGVAIGTSTKKLGFAVGKVREDQLQAVPAASAANAIRGKVAGVRVDDSLGLWSDDILLADFDTAVRSAKKAAALARSERERKLVSSFRHKLR